MFRARGVNKKDSTHNPLIPSSAGINAYLGSDQAASSLDSGKTQFMLHFNNGIDPDLGLLNPAMYNVDFRPPYAPQTDSPNVSAFQAHAAAARASTTVEDLYYSKVFLFTPTLYVDTLPIESDQHPISFTHSLDLLLQDFAHHENQQFPFGINLSGMTGVIWRESPFRPDHSIKARKTSGSWRALSSSHASHPYLRRRSGPEQRGTPGCQKPITDHAR
ncbi:hypothetical protein B0H14DRAFT_2558930 [Mycena olivaceomarginata]|nr:hypothetical protein B0H14DRAFT_2558930 [Mycena olivaceomarginata]